MLCKAVGVVHSYVFRSVPEFVQVFLTLVCALSLQIFICSHDSGGTSSVFQVTIADFLTTKVNIVDTNRVKYEFFLSGSKI